ncbi:hypothetical protein ULF88_00705 [Halopseudomonas pachastrellae]|nr:hypothetical protein [Halopseudomonas pachastrellae]
MHVVDLFLDLMVEYGRKLRWFTVIGNHRVDKLRAMVSNPDTLITFPTRVLTSATCRFTTCRCASCN